MSGHVMRRGSGRGLDPEGCVLVQCEGENCIQEDLRSMQREYIKARHCLPACLSACRLSADIFVYWY